MLVRDKALWLAGQLDAGVFCDALVVFSDAPPMEITDMLPIHRFAVLPKGCACCSGKGGLVANLRNILKNQNNNVVLFDRIVLEVGGICSLGEVASVIQNDPVLKKRILVTELIVALDGSERDALLGNEPMLARQIEEADCVVMTKGQSFSTDFETAIRGLNASAPIFGSAVA